MLLRKGEVCLAENINFAIIQKCSECASGRNERWKHHHHVMLNILQRADAGDCLLFFDLYPVEAMSVQQLATSSTVGTDIILFR
jgi:hypothetical protein